MQVSISSHDNQTLVSLSGRVDTTNAEQFLQDISPLMEGDNPDIVVDCSGMDYTSSQGLRVFLMLQKSVGSRKGRLVLKDMQPQVREVFDITGFSNIITIV